MFYQDNRDNSLRFGDVLKGYVLTAPILKDPSSLHADGYSVEVLQPAYSVLLSPCCSIKPEIILTPLIQLKPSFYQNPYFEEDLTRINRKMKPEQSVSPLIWNNKFSDAERQKRQQEGINFAVLDIFIYEQNPLFEKYKLNLRGRENLEINYYMIDFKSIYKIKCENIKSAENAPLSSKCLQLSIATREELRKKLSNYFSRVPEEDKPFID